MADYKAPYNITTGNNRGTAAARLGNPFAGFWPQEKRTPKIRGKRARWPYSTQTHPAIRKRRRRAHDRVARASRKVNRASR